MIVYLWSVHKALGDIPSIITTSNLKNPKGRKTDDNERKDHFSIANFPKFEKNFLICQSLECKWWKHKPGLDSCHALGWECHHFLGINVQLTWRHSVHSEETGFTGSVHSGTHCLFPLLEFTAKFSPKQMPINHIYVNRVEKKATNSPLSMAHKTD